MPTLPPLPEASPQEIRQVAESFGSDAERYDRARPRYPDALIRRIVAAAPGPDVLDVGCGTGIVARQLQAAGVRVLGVDVDARMVDLARQTGVEAEVSAFETWDPAGRAFDAVVCGQAWHWVDAVAGAAKAAEALRPGGLLAIFWNVFQPSPEVAQAFAEVDRRVMGQPHSLWERPALGLYSSGFAKTADGIRQAEAFGEPEEWRYEWDHVYTRDEWLDQVPTHGGSSRLPEATLRELLTGIGAAVDAMGGRFTMHYTTVAVTATRTAG